MSRKRQEEIVLSVVVSAGLLLVYLGAFFVALGSLVYF